MDHNPGGDVTRRRHGLRRVTLCGRLAGEALINVVDKKPGYITGTQR